MGCSCSTYPSARDQGDPGEPLRPESAQLYTEAASIWQALSCSHGGVLEVRLLRGTWLRERARLRLPVPRRQDLEKEAPEAFIDVAALQALPTGQWGKLPIVAVSYAWESAEHPDPRCEQLVALVDAFETTPSGSKPLPSEFGVFFDWMSLCQKDAEGHRSQEEQLAFDEALKRMQLWYAHALTTVYLLTAPTPTAASLPVEGRAPAYSERGWPTFESAVACLAKKSSSNCWAPLVDVGHPRSVCDACGQVHLKRVPPLVPDKFQRQLELCHFTNGKSDCEVVAGLYRQTVLGYFSETSELYVGSAGWGDPDVEILAEVLPFCTHVTHIILSENHITDRGASTIAEALKASVKGGVLTNLIKLCLHSNQVGDDGVLALSNAIRERALMSLQILVLRNNRIGDTGAAALVSACAASDSGLQRLFLGDNRIDDAGIGAIADAARAGAWAKLCKLSLDRNAFSERGASMLAQALSSSAFLSLVELTMDRSMQGSMHDGLRDACESRKIDLKGRAIEIS